MNITFKLLIAYLTPFANVLAYSDIRLISGGIEDDDEMLCKEINHSQSLLKIHKNMINGSLIYKRIKNRKKLREDPINALQFQISKALYGSRKEINADNSDEINFLSYGNPSAEDILADYPTGNALHAEKFLNGTAVHMIHPPWLLPGYSRLKITDDYMQTAVNAFFILLEGNLDDILRLPAEYMLNSTRTISMMKLTKEKVVAIWTVIKQGRPPDEIPYETLEKFRPLFKYLNAREIAKLNLKDNRILSYIGTHPDLNRHQVGVVASVYIKLNRAWSQPRYLNMMNNLLCGVPMTFMRKVPDSTYLQLSHQVFYHIRACDPMQRRFYLSMMTKSQALGKWYSWTARDVARLGLLLAVVEGPYLSTIKPEAMNGITARVMREMKPENLMYITDEQLNFIHKKAYTVLAKKLHGLQSEDWLSAGESVASFGIKKMFPLFILYHL